MANISAQSNNPQVVHMGVFASASFATLKMKKEVELWEVCHVMLPKVPRAYSKVSPATRIERLPYYMQIDCFTGIYH
jgi:dynein heavy chain